MAGVIERLTLDELTTPPGPDRMAKHKLLLDYVKGLSESDLLADLAKTERKDVLRIYWSLGLPWKAQNLLLDKVPELKE